MDEKLQNFINEVIDARFTAIDFKIPSHPHAHTGIGTLPINIKDIIIMPGIGVPFVNGNNSYSIYINQPDNVLIIEPTRTGNPPISLLFDNGKAELFINLFNKVIMTTFASGISALTSGFNFVSSDDLGDNLEKDFTPFIEKTTITDIGRGNVTTEMLDTITGKTYTADRDFAIQLPDTSLPSPVAGMYAFNAGQFWKCEVTGTWLNF